MFRIAFLCILDLCLSDDETPQGIIESDGAYICMTCGKSFSKRSNANRHFQTKHMPVSQVKCHVCNKVFKNAVYRNAHRVKEHKITEKMMQQSRRKLSVPKIKPEPDEE